MNVLIGSFSSFACPEEAEVMFTDPPYGLDKVYAMDRESIRYDVHVSAALQWSKAKWNFLLGPAPLLRDFLPRVPQPDYIIWWHRTFLLPRRQDFFSPSITPILVYRQPGAKWYGPDKQERGSHDVIDAHSNMGDITRLKALGIKLPKHPALTGTSLPKKILPWVSQEGDLVVDPFAGCGSILVSALRLGRIPFGCEIVPEYAAAANQWIEAERQKLCLSS